MGHYYYLLNLCMSILKNHLKPNGRHWNFDMLTLTRLAHAGHQHEVFSTLYVVKHWCPQWTHVKNNEFNKHM
jgi:hypothetical protein